jgi:hypothetical protein
MSKTWSALRLSFGRRSSSRSAASAASKNGRVASGVQWLGEGPLIRTPLAIEERVTLKTMVLVLPALGRFGGVGKFHPAAFQIPPFVLRCYDAFPQ